MINQIYIHRATQNMEHTEAHRTQQTTTTNYKRKSKTKETTRTTNIYICTTTQNMKHVQGTEHQQKHNTPTSNGNKHAGSTFNIRV